MKKLLILIPILLIGCGNSNDYKKVTNTDTIRHVTYIHKGKPITCISMAMNQLSCDWISYHKE